MCLQQATASLRNSQILIEGVYPTKIKNILKKDKYFTNKQLTKIIQTNYKKPQKIKIITNTPCFFEGAQNITLSKKNNSLNQQQAL